MYVVRKQLDASEGDPPNTRYNPDCDCVEITVDGGTTWTPSPAADPRISPPYLLPPTTEPDPRCAAAAGMVSLTERFIENAIAGSTTLSIANGALNILLVFIPISWMVALIWAIAEALLAIGSAALIAAFTEETYEGLLCIFYDAIGDDGQMSAEQLEDTRSAIASEFGGVVSLATDFMFSALGYVGVSNAGVKLADSSAICTPCVENCIFIGFDEESYPYTFIPFDSTTGTGSVDMTFGDPAPSGKGYSEGDGMFFGLEIVFPEPRNILALSFYYYQHNNPFGTIFVRNMVLKIEDGTVVANVQSVSGAANGAWDLWVPFGAWDGENIKTVQLFMGISGGTANLGECWMDNIAICFE